MQCIPHHFRQLVERNNESEMAAYAALLTLSHTIDQIQHHPRLPISLDEGQLTSLTEEVTFLQESLEAHSHGRYTNTESADALGRRIADAARAADDIIESYVLDQILVRWENKKFHNYLGKLKHFAFARSKMNGENKFHEGLEKAAEAMDLIKQEFLEMKETTTQIEVHLSRPHRRSSFKALDLVVGFDDVINEMMDKLTGHESRLQAIPIAGMAGIGKTTLARSVYSNPFILEYFDVFAWATISREYNIREIFVQLLNQMTKVAREDLHLLEKSENELKEEVHKFLMGRRYLIVLDDIWDIKVWEEIRLFFPDCSNGSRVGITTRLTNLASRVNHNSYCLKMELLDEDKSWDLFCRVVFGEENCSVDHLEEIGKKIAKLCKGLPLSLCVVGGLLAKSEEELEYWEYVRRNLNSVVNLENNEHCLKLLYMSYSQLPTHLKPCFLYMGVFPEDEKIRVSELIEQWLAEGFLKPIGRKSLQVVGEEYFNELIERNLVRLVLVHSLGSLGTVKYCNIHLLRDFWSKCRQSFFLRLDDSLENMFHSVHSHYFAGKDQGVAGNTSSLFGDRFWNIKTLIMYSSMVFSAPSEIWNMPHLRHVRVQKLELPDPPYGDGNDIILGNLQMLSVIDSFKCSEEIIKRIPNIKRLETRYQASHGTASHEFIKNIDRLCKLESFVVTFLPITHGVFQDLTFPQSLKLTIRRFSADEFLGKIGSLPHLVKLKLIEGIFDSVVDSAMTIQVEQEEQGNDGLEVFLE